jgi:hypothetical protein
VSQEVWEINVSVDQAECFIVDNGQHVNLVDVWKSDGRLEDKFGRVLISTL